MFATYKTTHLFVVDVCIISQEENTRPSLSWFGVNPVLLSRGACTLAVRCCSCLSQIKVISTAFIVPKISPTCKGPLLNLDLKLIFGLCTRIFSQLINYSVLCKLHGLIDSTWLPLVNATSWKVHKCYLFETFLSSSREHINHQNFNFWL